MRLPHRGRLLLVPLFLAATAIARAQHAHPTAPASTDLSLTYAPERAQVAPGNCCFWMQGGSAEAAVTFWKGFGIAAVLNGDHASKIASGVPLNKIAYLVGPRYTFLARTSHANTAASPQYQVFGEGLFGGVHGFDGVYPNGSSTSASANAFSLQAGVGLNYWFKRNLGLRLFEADYVRTQLSNGGSNSQNDLRLSFGLTVHVGSRLRR